MHSRQVKTITSFAFELASLSVVGGGSVGVDKTWTVDSSASFSFFRFLYAVTTSMNGQIMDEYTRERSFTSKTLLKTCNLCLLSFDCFS